MDGTADLFGAIARGDAVTVAALLAADPGLARARNAGGVSAALWALYHGAPQIAEQLIARAGPLDICEAAAAGRDDDVARLLAGDSSLANAVAPDGFSPLGLAAFFGHLAAAAVLVAHGADVHRASANRMRVQPLHSAAAHRQLTIAELLLEHGAAVNAVQADDFTPLHAAAQNGDLPMAQLLLRYGADPHARTSDGQTALDIARAAGHLDLVALLTPLP